MRLVATVLSLAGLLGLAVAFQPSSGALMMAGT